MKKKKKKTKKNQERAANVDLESYVGIVYGPLIAPIST